MRTFQPNRGLARNRHGRGIRRPYWSNRIGAGTVRKGTFEVAVDDAAHYLRSVFPSEFANLRTVISNLPPATAPGVPLYRIHKATETIYLYRIPIERLRQRSDRIDEMIRIEEIVIQAAAKLVDQDPRNFLESY